MRISDWSSDVCSSDLGSARQSGFGAGNLAHARARAAGRDAGQGRTACNLVGADGNAVRQAQCASRVPARRSEEHTSELQSLMRISYAVFCLKKKKQETQRKYHNILNLYKERTD